jgi:hypothetical protein
MWENRRLAIESVSAHTLLIKKLEQCWEIESIPSGTCFTFIELIKIKGGVLGEFLGVLMRPIIRSTTRIILLKLKNIAEEKTM